MEDLLCASEAGKLLGLTSDAIRYHEKLGRLETVRVERGQGQVMKLYHRDEIARFLRQRVTAKSSEAHHS